MMTTNQGDMPLYVGTKEVYAEPMTLGAYNKLRGWTLPKDEDPDTAGYFIVYKDGGKPNLDGFPGYVSWSPADVFDRAYRRVEEAFDFGEAVRRLKAGARVARAGWNGKGMCLYYVPPGAYLTRTAAACAEFGDNALVPYQAYIAMVTVQRTVVPWLASQTDVLAEDWEVVG